MTVRILQGDCMADRIDWKCPHCGTGNHDEIDPVDGPFITCTCDDCGKSFSQDEVAAK